MSRGYGEDGGDTKKKGRACAARRRRRRPVPEKARHHPPSCPLRERHARGEDEAGEAAQTHFGAPSTKRLRVRQTRKMGSCGSGAAEQEGESACSSCDLSSAGAEPAPPTPAATPRRRAKNPFTFSRATLSASGETPVNGRHRTYPYVAVTSPTASAVAAANLDTPLRRAAQRAEMLAYRNKRKRSRGY